MQLVCSVFLNFFDTLFANSYLKASATDMDELGNSTAYLEN